METLVQNFMPIAAASVVIMLSIFLSSSVYDFFAAIFKPAQQQLDEWGDEWNN